jgi:hypothetical protein
VLFENCGVNYCVSEIKNIKENIGGKVENKIER